MFTCSFYIIDEFVAFSILFELTGDVGSPYAVWWTV